MNYDWQCHSCSTTNDAGADRCIHCSCPAIASAHTMAQFSTKAEPAVKAAVHWYTFNRVVAALFLLIAAVLSRHGALFFISVLLSVLVLTNGECKRKHRFADLLFGLGNALAVGACVLMASAVLTSANALARATIVEIAMLCALILLGSGFALLLLRLWPGAKD